MVRAEREVLTESPPTHRSGAADDALFSSTRKRHILLITSSLGGPVVPSGKENLFVLKVARWIPARQTVYLRLFPKRSGKQYSGGGRTGEPIQ